MKYFQNILKVQVKKLKKILFAECLLPNTLTQVKEVKIYHISIKLALMEKEGPLLKLQDLMLS